jgi:hypothetical protein
MRDYRVYVCEKCGQEFPNDHDGCEEHENGHIRPDNYALWDNGSYQPDSRYPAFIRIPMADGTEAMYQYDSSLPAQKNSSPAIGSSQESLKEEPFTF